MLKKLLLGLLLTTTYTGHAYSVELLARVSFVELHDRVSPSRGLTSTKVEIGARITSAGQMSVTEDRASGRYNSSNKDSTNLGSAGKKQLWRVVDQNRIANYTAYSNFTRVIHLSIDGPRCSIDVSYALGPGQSEYRYTRLSTGEKAIARSISASNLNCELKTI